MYLSQWQFKRTKTESGNISNPYNAHKALWKTFPGREKDNRDFLYRMDKKEDVYIVIMLSESKPEATIDLDLIRIVEPQIVFKKEKPYRFSLRANPVKRLSEQRVRVPLVGEENLNIWLSKKLTGVAKLFDVTTVSRANLNFCKGDNWGKITTVDFEGVIQCEDPQNLLNLVRSGIGPAKAFGCGLLLLKKND